MNVRRIACALLVLAACDSPSAPDGGSGADAASSSDAAVQADAGFVPAEPTLPSATGACPDFSASGRITVSPSGVAPREVQLWISDAAATLDGPLVFYWHGTGSRPEEAQFGLGPETMEAILALGGMVIAPTHDPAAGDFPWYLTVGSADDDLRVADEALACAIATVGVDVRRIHSIGMSAGGLHTTQMSYRRASYLASVVTYSGGLIAARRPPSDEPDNRFAALIFHGGADDVVVISFEDASERYWQLLTERDHFAAICDHGGGHSIPTDARASVWQFFRDHPYGAHPSPYAAGLPAGFVASCALAP